MSWHSKEVQEVFKELNTTPEGLSSSEVRKRLTVYGLNEIRGKPKSPLKLFLKQFTNFLILILLIATLISGFLGELVDALAILLIVLIMGVSGFLQEFRAEKAIEALKKLVVSEVKAVRDGKVVVVPSTELVPGDVILLGEGDKVPADIRLIDSVDLKVDESPLTGESEPVLKDHSAVLPEETSIHSRTNMLFMGTYIYSGKCKGVVVATGSKTELGKIAEKLGEIKEKKTLLEEELDKLGKKLGAIILGISVLVFSISYLVVREPLIESLLLAVALAVAAIPEGLPAIATSVLALGAYRMSKKNVIVRELGAIETLGACDVVASDKTGTITKGEMTVKKVWVSGVELGVSGEGFEPVGEVVFTNSGNEALISKELEKLAEYLVVHIGEDASLFYDNGVWRIKGSPTEGAALVFAHKVLGSKRVENLKKNTELVKVIPFDRFRKRKTTIHKLSDDEYLVISSGAPELLLSLSSYVLIDGSLKPLNDELKKEINEYIESIASQGFRTYGFAYKLVKSEVLEQSIKEVEEGLTFLSVMGIIDPPREGVKEAVEELRRAGIKTVMITGDHRLTAEAIGRLIGLDEGLVLEGKDLDKMSDAELERVIDDVVVLARVTPEHKRRVVKALQARGHVVAMTGDGVNDALALKEADLGIAMGIKGTDVAKEVSKLVIKDDNFVTIAAAVKEGRVIFENLKKPINYLLPANLGEIATILSAELAMLPSPLTPAQLLWINVTTDALPALALSSEPPEPDLMKRPPRKRQTPFLTNRKIAYFVLLGSLIGLVNLAIYTFTLGAYMDRDLARTLVFIAIGMSEFGRALVSRSENMHFWFRPFNKWLIPSIIASLALLLATVYVPHLSSVFKTVELPPELIFLALLTSVPIMLVDELRKTLEIKI
ncbi:MAG: cation-translocating P-type ATPase [Zestosphaera sp.]